MSRVLLAQTKPGVAEGRGHPGRRSEPTKPETEVIVPILTRCTDVPQLNTCTKKNFFFSRNILVTYQMEQYGEYFSTITFISKFI